MAGSGGPWGGNGGSGGDDRNGQRPEGDRPGQRPGGRRPGEGPQMPEIDELMKKGQEHLRVLMGGRGGGGRGPAGAGSAGPMFSKQGIALGVIVALGVWV